MLVSGKSFESFFHDSGIPMHLIEEGLHLGSLNAGQNLELLRQNNVTKVLAFLDTFRYVPKFEGIEYVQIELPDSDGADLLQHLPKAIEFISNAQKNGENVLVHCAAGVSRSASIVIGYIMVKYSYDFETAKVFVKTRRGCIWPNPGFRQQFSSINVEDYKRYL